MMTSIHDIESSPLVISGLENPQNASGSRKLERALHALALLLAALLLLPYVIYLVKTDFKHNFLNDDSDLFSKRQLRLLFLSSIVLVTSLLAMVQKSHIPKFSSDRYRGTWFGHLMSEEGEWSHIPVVLCATYSFVLCYGALVSLATKCPLLCVPTFYVFGLLIFYAWHWAAHALEGTELNRIHMEHHHERYPAEDFYGDHHPEVQKERALRGGRAASLLGLMNPVGSTTTTWAHEGPLLFGIVGLLLVARFGVGLSKGTCAFILLGLVFMGTLGSAVHMTFHERDFELEPFAWYRELRSLHMIHHMHRKNFAMVNVVLDLVFCSLVIEG